ncbi:unnamed protein product [Pneumocystis jirovecii]|uniref:Branched-chain-amino-acid aminotransferase n=1 Tax=Pneumocystis jirovecii TaxID=42068 RepID=L0PE74_PNEJI|nr:unnamed protein product [Pneumocystis jirovecii]
MVSKAPLEAPLKSSLLTIEKTQCPKDLVPLDNLGFGKTFTDHMIVCDWEKSKGWSSPRIIPHQPFSLDPSSLVFHYGFECFEGMKAYKDSQGRILLFRPEMNMRRLNLSAARIALPTFDETALLECISKLLILDSRWIPSKKGYSLYIRPAIIATENTLQLRPSLSASLFVIASPVEHGLGGLGDIKVGGNYASGIRPQLEAYQKGYDQILWLFGAQRYVTEAGSMNCFVCWTTPHGQKQLITAPLDGTILPGVIRDSVLTLARERLAPRGWNVLETLFTLDDLILAASQHRLLEVFGTGTAAVISSVRKIGYNGGEITLPAESWQAGSVALTMHEWITEIQYGSVNHPWTYIVDPADTETNTSTTLETAIPKP